MFLARVPNPAVPPGTLHQHLYGYFDADKGSSRPFVFREENDGKTICLLSRLPPATERRRLHYRIRAGCAYQFEALLSPVNSRNIEGKSRTRVIRTNAERHAWLARATQGASLRFVQFFDRPPKKFTYRGNRIVVHSCIARGVIYVEHLSQFREFLLTGPGKGKCWGCGLMYLPQVMDT